MKKSLLFITGLFILFLFTHCTDVDYGDGGTAGTNGDKLSFTLSIPGSAINTYASVDAIGGEDEVHSLHVLFFEPTSDGSGKFLEIHDISPADGAVYQSGQTIEIEFPENSNISKSSAYSLMFIANTTYYMEPYPSIDWKEQFADMTENDVKQLRIKITENSVTDPTDVLYYNYKSYIQNNLMMTGNINKEAGQDMVTAELTRIVARFDVKNKAGDEYKLVSASVWNAFPVQTIGEINFSDFTLDRIKRLYGINVSENDVTGGLYAYENYVSLPEQDDEVSTCLILGIEKDGATTYYRVNANLAGRPQQIRRNNVYTFNILNVKGPGENSEEDAYNSPDLNINVQINEWNVDDQGTIVIDGDNILAIATNNVRFNKLGGERQYTIFTAGEGTLIISDKDLPTGFTAELKGKEIYITATASEIDKAGYVELQFGKLKGTIYITQSGDIDLYLELSTNQLPLFDYEANQISELVTVSSSGTWTAKLYNHFNQEFIFQESSGIELTGDNEDQFSIAVTGANEDVTTRYAFVHVTLDENPQISGVVIISQNGLGGVQLDPQTEIVYFTADGNYETVDTDYTFDVIVENDNVEWIATLYGTNKASFEVTEDKENDKVSVNALGINKTNAELSAQLRVYLKENPALYTEVQIIQRAHHLSVSPETFANIPSTGGNSEEITVTSSTGWEATITVQGNDAYFNGQEGKMTITGNPGEKFYVTLPALTEGGVNPQVTITVTIPGTDLKETIILNQKAVEGKVINFQNSDVLYGYLTPTYTYYRYNYVEQLWQSLNSPDWFSPTGTVFCGGMNFMDVNVTPATSTDIFIMNSYSGDASTGGSARTWLESSDNRFLMLLSDDRTSTLLTYLKLTDLGYAGSGGTGNNVVKTDKPRTINTDDTYTMDTNKLYDYLFRSGPFTVGEDPIQKDQIQLLPYDASNNCLTAWPSTMIPLILDPHNSTRLLLGVDPTHRILYTGEMDLFTTMGVNTISYTQDGNTYTGAHNYYGGPYSEYNLKFLNNLIAWMTNVVMYGDEFTDQFK